MEHHQASGGGAVWFSGAAQLCTESAPLYCFQIDYSTAVKTPAPLGAFYGQLSESESRHFELYVNFARTTAPVLVYQRVISPLLPRRCKYEPTCSRYAVEAVRELGVVRGLILAGWRLLRCNPWSHGGYDPVSAQRLFPTRAARPRP